MTRVRRRGGAGDGGRARDRAGGGAAAVQARGHRHLRGQQPGEQQVREERVDTVTDESCKRSIGPSPG